MGRYAHNDYILEVIKFEKQLQLYKEKTHASMNLEREEW